MLNLLIVLLCFVQIEAVPRFMRQFPIFVCHAWLRFDVIGLATWNKEKKNKKRLLNRRRIKRGRSTRNYRRKQLPEEILPLKEYSRPVVWLSHANVTQQKSILLVQHANSRRVGALLCTNATHVGFAPRELVCSHWKFRTTILVIFRNLRSGIVQA